MRFTAALSACLFLAAADAEEWTSEIYCPALRSKSTNFDCKYFGRSVSCESRIVPLTRANLACKNFYKFPSTNDTGYQEITCLENGTWDRPVIFCEPECGIALPEDYRVIVHGSEIPYNRLPWHAQFILKHPDRIYRPEFYIGFLISPNFVMINLPDVTTLLVTDKRRNLSNWEVRIRLLDQDYAQPGNFWYEGYSTPKSDVKRVHLPKEYQYFNGSHYPDMSLLELKTPFTLSQLVRPICLDWSKATGQGQLSQEISQPYIGRQECQTQFSEYPGDDLGHVTFCVSPSNMPRDCRTTHDKTILSCKHGGLWYVSAVLLRVSLPHIRNLDPYFDVGLYLDWIHTTISAE